MGCRPSGRSPHMRLRQQSLFCRFSAQSFFPFFAIHTYDVRCFCHIRKTRFRDSAFVLRGFAFKERLASPATHPAPTATTPPTPHLKTRRTPAARPQTLTPSPPTISPPQNSTQPAPTGALFFYPIRS